MSSGEYLIAMLSSHYKPHTAVWWKRGETKSSSYPDDSSIKWIQSQQSCCCCCNKRCFDCKNESRRHDAVISVRIHHRCRRAVVAATVYVIPFIQHLTRRHTVIRVGYMHHHTNSPSVIHARRTDSYRKRFSPKLDHRRL